MGHRIDAGTITLYFLCLYYRFALCDVNDKASHNATMWDW